MSVAVKKVQGVESVKVSLNEGRAMIVLKPGNSVRLEQIRKAVEEQGFTPKDAKVKAVGDLTGTSGKLRFKVSGSNEVFPVVESHPRQRNQAAPNVLISGLIAAPPKGEQPGTIEIMEVNASK